MKIKLLLAFLFLASISCFSQSILAQKGVITLADNQKIAFNNVRLENGKFVFFDIKTGTEASLSIGEIKYIEDDRNSKVFTNKTVVDRTREADLKYEAEQKQLAIAETTRKEAEYKKKMEAERTAPALGLYPYGVYLTKEDFLNKKVTVPTEEIIAKEINGIEKDRIYGTPDECLFFYFDSDKKIRNVFAITYKGQLYFQISAILDNRNKTDRAQTNDHPNSFVRVSKYGENYYYLEATLANLWAQGFSYGAIGGVPGAIVANSLLNVKGIVWDVKNKEFNIFKNCEDYNDFIRDKYPAGIQQCNNHQADVLEIRKAIEQIK